MGRCAKAGMNFAEHRGQKSITAHGHEDAALGQQLYNHDRAVSYQNSQHNTLVQPRVGRLNHASGIGRSHLGNGYGYRCYAILTRKVAIIGNTCHHVTKQYI